VAITVDKDKTTIIDGAGNKSDIEGRPQIRNQVEETCPTTTARTERLAKSSAASR
jgi:hypothetical protein